MGIQIRKIPRCLGIFQYILPLIILILPLCSSLLPAPVFADDARAWANNSNVTKVVDKDGRELLRIIVPGRPPEKKAAAVSVPEVHKAGTLNSLGNVPAFNWSYGCSATSASMLSGYYDRTSYPNMYTGPANSGVCPMDNSVWGPGIGGSAGECPINASHNGKDGRTTRGHVDDYWITYGNADPDPYITNGWAEHTADSAGDFMGTNQSKYANTDGATSFYWYINGDPLYDYTGCEPGDRDGCHGMKLFAQSRGYTVQTNFTQLIQGLGTDPAKGFTFANFCSEIDAGRPVLIQIDGHTMLGYGYNTSGNVVYIHNTWDYLDHTMTWGGSYEGMQHYGVTVLRLNSPPAPTAPTVTNASGATSVTATSATLNGNLTSDGGAATTVHIYWGTTDGGTTAGNWTTDINHGVHSVGAFSTPLTSLTTGTTYYYRCSATNSAGTSWAAYLSSFIAQNTSRLLGADASDSGTNQHAASYICMTRYVAGSSGTLNLVKVKSAAAGHVKVAIYDDSDGQPGALRNANNTGAAVLAGQWNDVSIPSTPVSSGTAYWLAVNSDAIGAVMWNPGSGTMRYGSYSYSSDFPASIGSGLSPGSYHSLVAGWGTPPVLTITTTSLPDGTVGTPYSQAVQATGGTTPYTWSLSAGSLPAGLGPINSSTGVISGTPSATGTASFIIQVADSAAGTDTQELSITINSPPPLNITTISLPEASVGTAYSQTLQATGGIPPYTWSLSAGSLPAGLGPINSSTGVISGTPSTTGTANFIIQIADSVPTTDTQALSISVTLPVNRLLGADASDSGTNQHASSYLCMTRYVAGSSGTLNLVKVKSAAGGHVKAAIYTDSSGQPGALLNANNTGAAVAAGQWNDVSIPSTPVYSDTAYWLAVNSDATGALTWNPGSGTMRYGYYSYSSNFPASIGSGLNAGSYHSLVAGWGAPPELPPPPSLLSPGTSITFEWSAAAGATKYHLQVNTDSSFPSGPTMVFENDNIGSTTQEVTGLSLGILYYWRVRAGNTVGWSNWSSVRSVLTDTVP